MNKRIVLPLCLFSAFGYAQNNIETLKVANDVVYFSTTEAKTHTSPNCMGAANNSIWTMPLNTVTGKASYAMLVASLEKNRPITVEPANDCNAVAEYERAAHISLGPAVNIPVSQPSGKGYEVTTYFSGSIQIPKNSKGVLATITPPSGHRVKLTTLALSGTSGSIDGVTVTVGNNTVVNGFMLSAGSSYLANVFSVYSQYSFGRTGHMKQITGGENETIEISTTMSRTYYDAYYAYEFFKVE